MCVCVYVYLYMYRHIYMSVYVCVHVSMCVYIHIHRLIHTGDGTHDSAAHVGDKRARAPQGASRSGPGAHPHLHMRARARAHTHTHTHTHTQQELEAAKTGMHQKTLQIVRLQKQLRVAQTRADDFKQQATRLRQHQVDRPIEGVCMCGGAGGCRRTQLVFTHTCDTYIHI